jgi:hypothetical protein
VPNRIFYGLISLCIILFKWHEWIPDKIYFM